METNVYTSQYEVHLETVLDPSLPADLAHALTMDTLLEAAERIGGRWAEDLLRERGYGYTADRAGDRRSARAREYLRTRYSVRDFPDLASMASVTTT